MPVGRHPDIAVWDASKVTPDLFAKLVRTGNLFRISNGIEDWPALMKWQNPDYLASIIGDRKVDVWHEVSSGKTQISAVPYRELSRKMFSYGESHYYSDGIRCWSKQYSETALPGMFINGGQHELDGPLASLIPDIRVPNYLRQFGPLLIAFFGSRDSASPCHYHTGEDNVLCQVTGHKRVVCFPNTGLDLYRLYPQPWYLRQCNFSRIPFPWDGTQPAAAQYPKLAQAPVVEILLQPGDILFIPIFCWHIAYSQGSSISIAMFWKSSWRKRYLTLRGIRSNYFKQRKINAPITPAARTSGE